MVWESVTKGIDKAVKFNQWPNPVAAIVDLNVLMCNRDTWIAELEYIGGSVANFFWTQFIPSPRELERKAALGGYKCGFYLNEGFRSPLESIWGRDVQKALVEISNPFVTGLFFAWMASATIDALAIWQTVMFKQAFCSDFVGSYLYSGAHATASGVHTEGGVGLGHLDYDPHHYGNPFVADMNVPPGWTRMNVFWTFTGGVGPPMTVKTGFQVGSDYLEIEDHGTLLPGAILMVSRDFTYDDANSGHDIAPWWSMDGSPGSTFYSISAVRVIGDHKNITPDTQQPTGDHRNHQHRPRPHCATDYL